MDKKKVYTVSELNQEIKNLVEPRYQDFWVEGEVSNFKIYPSGHAYFTLKDENSQIQAVMFAGEVAGLKFRPADGLKVLVRGRISLYLKSGRHQIVAQSMEPLGKGALQEAFEQLKKKLSAEGLFDESRKRPIPMLPSKIGVVTSPAGAAIRDILTVINRRFANVEVLIYPAAVQGENAKYEIAEGIEYLNKNHPELDVLLVGRGGGSYEDLWAFNEEIVARAIYNSGIPVVSCVGHEVDFTIADFVADVRAPTPSAAAELVVRNKSDLADKIKRIKASLVILINQKLSAAESDLRHLASSGFFKNPFEYLNRRAQDLDYLTEKLYAAARNIETAVENRFRMVVSRLHLLSPLSVLSRGYSVCWKVRPSDGKKILLKNSKDVKSGDEVDIRLNEGGFISKVSRTY